MISTAYNATLKMDEKSETGAKNSHVHNSDVSRCVVLERQPATPTTANGENDPANANNSMNDNDATSISATSSLSEPPYIRSHRRLTQALKSHNHYSTESDSDDESIQPARKRARKQASSDKRGPVLVGYHADEPTLPLYAVFNKIGHLRLEAYKDNMGEDVLSRWNVLVQSNNQVSVENAILDKKIFKSYPSKLEGIDKKKKIELIREFLMGKWEGGERNLEESAPDKSVIPSHGLQVGFFYDDPDLPVYACLQRRPGQDVLMFRVRNSEADKSAIHFGSVWVAYENINFNNKFIKGGKEETRDYIRSLLTPNSLLIRKSLSKTSPLGIIIDQLEAQNQIFMDNLN
jgi:hypothetical protein